MSDLILSALAILVVGGVMYYTLNRVEPELAKYLDAKAEEMRLYSKNERRAAYEQGFADAIEFERYTAEGNTK